jgi:hypothetical protein
MLRTLLIVALAASRLAAQQTGTGAVLVLYQIKPGMARDFELGDQRHLDWHRGQKDPWLWPGWTIGSGEHQGYFIDATFFHPWTDFDNPVANPSQDGANWSVNVAPYADIRSYAHYDGIPALTTLRPDALSAPLMTVCYVTVHPGAGTKFESAIAAGLHAATMPHLVLRPVSGAAEYLIMLTAQKQADLPVDAELLESVMQTAGPFVDRARTETWTYRPELSYMPR